MTAVVSFIGWHNSGKTTISSRVVKLLREAGYKVGVVKSTKEMGLFADREGTDSHKYQQAGAERVGLLTPEGLVLRQAHKKMSLAHIVQGHFSDMDIVIAEGFKNEENVAKIEVAVAGAKPLRYMVPGVVGVVSGYDRAGLRNDEESKYGEITSFVEEFFIKAGGKYFYSLYLLVY